MKTHQELVDSYLDASWALAMEQVAIRQGDLARELEESLTGCLKPEELELYRLVVKEEQKTAQVAERLSISYTNAATRIYRMRKKLKRQLSPARGKEDSHGKKAR